MTDLDSIGSLRASSSRQGLSRLIGSSLLGPMGLLICNDLLANRFLISWSQGSSDRQGSSLPFTTPLDLTSDPVFPEVFSDL